MRNNQNSSVDERFQLASGCGAITMTDAGLVFTGGSLLVRMRKTAEGRQTLAIGADRERMLAMLSIAYGQPFAAADVVPHVETAADLWRRGDKAVADLRLMFAGLGGLSDPSAEYRAALAACLLDQGWPPAALLEELGLANSPGTLEKYNPNHVPAGNGVRSGQFDFAPGTSQTSDGRIVVAGGDNDGNFDTRDMLGETSPKEELEHHRPITLVPPIPVMGGAIVRPLEAVTAAARAAKDKVGPGKGPVYGTNVHTQFKGEVKAQNRTDLHPEQSYLGGRSVKYGTRGSVRVDVAQPTVEMPHAVYDLKTGGAALTDVRREQFRMHLPKRDDGKESKSTRYAHETSRTQASFPDDAAGAAGIRRPQEPAPEGSDERSSESR